MPNPKHKTSKARRDSRRAHTKLSEPIYTPCPQCREPKRPHYACLNCGTYKGREVIAVKNV